jgi:hypothetical protein
LFKNTSLEELRDTIQRVRAASFHQPPHPVDTQRNNIIQKLEMPGWYLLSAALKGGGRVAAGFVKN